MFEALSSEAMAEPLHDTLVGRQDFAGVPRGARSLQKLALLQRRETGRISRRRRHGGQDFVSRSRNGGVERFHRRRHQQAPCCLLVTVQPGIQIGGIHMDQRPLVLLLGWKHEAGHFVDLGPVEPSQQGMTIAVRGDQREVRHHLAGGQINPFRPEACQEPGHAVRPCQLPPDILACLPVGLLVPRGGGDTPAARQPRRLERGLLFDILDARVVRRAGSRRPWFLPRLGLGFDVLHTLRRARSYQAPLTQLSDQAVRPDEQPSIKRPDVYRLVIGQQRALPEIALGIAFGAHVIQVAHALTVRARCC